MQIDVNSSTIVTISASLTIDVIYRTMYNVSMDSQNRKLNDVSRETEQIINAVDQVRPLTRAGRVSDYGPGHVKMARALVRMGYTSEKLADAFGINSRTLCEWQNRYPELKRVIETERSVADAQVAAALFKKATGFTRNAKKAMQHNGEVVVAEYEEEVPPDTAAAFIWLKNRQPALWRDRHEVTGADGRPIEVNLSWLNGRQVTDVEDVEDKNVPHLPDQTEKNPNESNT